MNGPVPLPNQSAASNTEVSILLLEDSPADAELIVARLEDEGMTFKLTRAHDRSTFARALAERTFDIILSDYNVPGFDGGAALDAARRAFPDTPFIFVSGALGEELAIDLLKRGATDYVLKDRPDRLPSSVQRALREAREREELKAIEAEKDAARKRLEVLAEASRVLASSLDYEATLQNVIRLVLPDLGDFGFFDVVQRDGSVRRIARAHDDPRKEFLLQDTCWTDAERGGFTLSALSAGQAASYPTIDDAWLQKVAADSRQLAVLRELNFQSLMTVPLRYHERALGAFTLFFAGSNRRHGDADLALATELAQRAAAAIENAELYRSQVEARKEIEDLAVELQRRNERARAMLAALAEGLVLQDASGKVVHANAAAEQLLGSSINESGPNLSLALGNVFREDGTAWPAEEFPANVALRTGTPQARQVVGIRRADGDIWLHVNSQPLFDANGVTGVISSFYDITDRKRIEAEEKRRLEFEQQLIGIVSHDLRDPLNVITLASQLLLADGSIGTPQRKNVERIKSSAQRASRLIQALLDFTQARLRGGIRISRSEFDFHDVTQQALDDIRFAWPNREIRHNRSGDGRGRWDGDRLAQVVTNLVANALRYSPDGTPVSVSTRAGDGGVVLEVHNDGPPIPEELLPHLFECLQRGAKEGPRQRGSVGLGLFIVHEIVHAHGGQVTVASAAGAGTTFTVQLPSGRDSSG